MFSTMLKSFDFRFWQYRNLELCVSLPSSSNPTSTSKHVFQVECRSLITPFDRQDDDTEYPYFPSAFMTASDIP